MQFSIGTALAAVTLSAALASPALARTAPANGLFVDVPAGASSIDLDLTGWVSFGGFGVENNTTLLLDVAAGTQILGFEYVGLEFTTSNGSFLSEMTLSVNNSDASVWLDWRPSTTAGEGSFSGSGSWGGPTGTAGSFGAGGPFVSDGLLVVTVYESFDDPFGDGGATLDATLTGGTLRIMLAPVPEPGTYGLMALGLLAVGGVLRKRQQQA